MKVRGTMDTVIGTLRDRVECFILGTAAAARLVQEELLVRGAAPADGFKYANEYRGVPFLVSKIARPDTVECLFRETDGTLNKAICVSPEQFADMIDAAAKGEL